MRDPSTILVTGAGGFIGSHLCDVLLRLPGVERVVGVDAERTGWSPHNLTGARLDPRFAYLRADIRDADAMHAALDEHAPEGVVHLAAETHVDRSIEDSRPFFEVNVLGTQTLLEACRGRPLRRFVNVITDEVFGEIETGESREDDPLRPRSPYAASKAAQYHLGTAFHVTHEVPVVAVFPSNTYGPRQYPEKLIPRFVTRLVAGRQVPLMASHHHTRDWMWVGDLCDGLVGALQRGQPGRGYNLGGGEEVTNLELTLRILAQLGLGEDRIETVPDRPGHDQRYRVCTDRARTELDWTPGTDLAIGLPRTIRWVRDHGAAWWPSRTE